MKIAILYALVVGALAWSQVSPEANPTPANLDLADQQSTLLVARDPAKPDEEYEWLEQAFGPEALEWAQNETRRTVDYIDNLPPTRHVMDEVMRLIDGGPPPTWSVTGHSTFSISGDRVFRVRTTTENPKGLLEGTKRSPDGSLGEWDVLLDIDDISRTEGGNFIFRSGASIDTEDASRYLVLLVANMTNSVEVREIDIATGEIVPDGFNVGHGITFLTWLDIDHVLISTTAVPGNPTTYTGYPATWSIWERGTPLSEATEIHRVADNAIAAFSLSLGKSGAGYGLLMEATASFGLALRILSPDRTVKEIIGVPERLVFRFDMVSTARHLIVVTAEETTIDNQTVPEGSLLAYEFSPCVSEEDRVSVAWTPEPGELSLYIADHGLAASKSQVHLTVTKDGVERRLVIGRIEGEWKVVEETETPEGSLIMLESGNRFSNDIVVMETGLIRAPVASIFGENSTRTILHQQAESFPGDDFFLQTLQATSKDGTVIDYILVSPRSFDNHNSTAGRRPVLLHGYGGFGRTLPTTYLDLHLAPWLEAGGSIAYAFIRGGGERGTSWHQAAVGPIRRQNSFDDFIAVAEDIIDNGFTSPDNMGAYGISNGGLLMGVMATQRPDLFGAIVCDAPVLDMLRFPVMSAEGVAWLGEFGDPSDPEVTELLRRWSPFHNVREDVEYPAFLATAATGDTTTGPGHARKMVARMRDAGIEEAYFYEVEEGGHALLNSYLNPELMAHRTAFLILNADEDNRDLVKKPRKYGQFAGVVVSPSNHVASAIMLIEGDFDDDLPTYTDVSPRDKAALKALLYGHHDFSSANPGTSDSDILHNVAATGAFSGTTLNVTTTWRECVARALFPCIKKIGPLPLSTLSID
ncbi:hypothetical protein F5X68DRAFT_264162 [Plectosphaerella plurivora]|uniref:Prolyl endopeptidase n=1 Tax=Plectosphaerella plurivora TaxID=936078 RepID=A0A9P8V5J0_9PEZI|nr:hypothetical protein F5X68DRAFT_264162 [Plectosphaerella plurivora]